MCEVKAAPSVLSFDEIAGLRLIQDLLHHRAGLECVQSNPPDLLSHREVSAVRSTMCYEATDREADEQPGKEEKRKKGGRK